MEKVEEVYAYQIDLDEYFDHLKKTLVKEKNHSTRNARVALKSLQHESKKDVKSLSKRTFSFSEISFGGR